MKNQVVSIVTPCYNGESYIERFFESILKQSYQNIEVVFINDGSTDRTEEIVNNYIKKFSQRKIPLVYKYQRNMGQASALNNGLKDCKGEFILWMDSDDAISSDYIRNCLLYFDEHPGCMYVYGKSEWIQESDGKVIRIAEKMKDNSNFFEDIIYVKNVFFPGYMVRSTALDKTLHNREIYTGKGGQNAQLLLPLSWKYGRPEYVDNAVYYYYVRENSHSHSLKSSVQIIEQLHNYEIILIETIRKMSINEAKEYIPAIQKYYAKLRYGNAIDTKNRDLVSKYFKELRATGITEWKDFALYVKYTNIFIRFVFNIRD